MTKGSLLTTLPNHDITNRYISAWANLILDERGSKSFNGLYKLEDIRASRNEFESMVKKHKPTFIFLNGHGDENCVCGQNDEPVLQKGMNEEISKDAVVYALSCRSGSELADACVIKGAKAYLGYTEDFVFLYNENKIWKPCEDTTAELFFKPSNAIVASLSKGHSVQEAFEAGQKGFFRSVQKLLTSESSSDDSQAVKYLVWNLQSLRATGDVSATV